MNAQGRRSYFLDNPEFIGLNPAQVQRRANKRWSLKEIRLAQAQARQQRSVHKAKERHARN